MSPGLRKTRKGKKSPFAPMLQKTRLLLPTLRSSMCWAKGFWGSGKTFPGRMGKQSQRGKNALCDNLSFILGVFGCCIGAIVFVLYLMYDGVWISNYCEGRLLGMERKMSDGEAIELWTRKVFARAKEIDPSNEYDWQDLALGFLLALDFELTRAFDLIERMIDLGVI